MVVPQLTHSESLNGIRGDIVWFGVAHPANLAKIGGCNLQALLFSSPLHDQPVVYACCTLWTNYKYIVKFHCFTMYNAIPCTLFILLEMEINEIKKIK